MERMGANKIVKYIFTQAELVTRHKRYPFDFHKMLI